MNREQLINYIREQYGLDEEYLWVKYPRYAVFRHNKKWFALIMDVQKNKLGIDGDGLIDIVDLKCDPLLISSLRHENGFFPAYHMNKETWISVALDGSVAREKIVQLIDLSYEMTGKRNKKKSNS